MKIQLPGLHWRNEPMTSKQLGKIEQMEDELDLPRDRLMQLAGYPHGKLENLNKGEASDLIGKLEDLY